MYLHYNIMENSSFTPVLYWHGKPLRGAVKRMSYLWTASNPHHHSYIL